MSFLGFDIYVVPEFLEVPKPLAERIFSWPWHPFRKTKFIANEACPPAGEFVVDGNRLYGSRATVDRLRKEPQITHYLIDGNPLGGIH